MSVYWCSNYLFDFLSYTIIVFGTLLAMHAFSVAEYTEVHQTEVATIATFLFYGLSVIPLAYLMSRSFSSPSSAQVAIASILFVFGKSFVLV